MSKLKLPAAAAMLVVAPAAQAANISMGRDNIGRPIIVLDGPIVGGDADSVAQLLRPGLFGIRLNSPCGIYEAARIAEMVRFIRLPAIVMRGDGAWRNV